MSKDYSKYNYADNYGRSTYRRTTSGPYGSGGSQNIPSEKRKTVKVKVASASQDAGRPSRVPENDRMGAGELVLRLLGLAALAALAFLLFTSIVPEVRSRKITQGAPQEITETPQPAARTETPPAESGEPEVTGEDLPEETAAPVPAYEFLPHAVESTEPSNLIDRVRIMVNETELTDTAAYENPYGEISFDSGSEYTQVEGIVTFRGNNYRNDPTYGEVETLSSKRIDKAWEITTATTTDYWGNVWTGSGWTGQPLVARWPKSVRAVMTSMYDWAKTQEELVEVIYPTMDGRVYFTELQTGKATRNSLNMGITYKGCGALDPRGYPILYLGGGVKNVNGKSNISIVNLLDNSVMYSFASYDAFGARDWPCFDSSPLVDAETDQLLYPAENGLVYLVHLNTQYDEKAGTLSVAPDNTVKWRYHNKRNDESQTAPPFFGGIESSAAVYDGYAFLTENGGALMCLDLNTLQLVWVQDILDDSNSTPVIDVEADGHPYLYVSTSFHLGWRSSSTATVPIWKIDAETGEIVWQVDYECQSEKGVSGGVEGTIAIDDENIYVPVARTGGPLAGVLVSIDKKTGEKNWEFTSKIYSWASPIRFDDKSGAKYILYNNGNGGEGYLYMLNAATGELLYTYTLGGVGEASGVVFDNWLVIGHRSCRILGLKLS